MKFEVKTGTEELGTISMSVDVSKVGYSHRDGEKVLEDGAKIVFRTAASNLLMFFASVEFAKLISRNQFELHDKLKKLSIAEVMDMYMKDNNSVPENVLNAIGLGKANE